VKKDNAALAHYINARMKEEEEGEGLKEDGGGGPEEGDGGGTDV
jgi:hypothetical protein